MTLDVRAHVASSVVPRVLDVIAQRHTSAIVRTLFKGPKTFDVLVRTLRISRSTLVSRLGHLVREACVERREKDYALTPRGRSLFALLCILSAWDDRASGFRHTPCGAPLSVTTCCAACDTEVHARDVALPEKPCAPALEAQITRTRGLARAGLDTLDAEALLSDKWTSRVVALAFYGVRRFAEMESALGIATNVLTDRLERLVQHHVLERVVYEERPKRSEYVLTPRGHALFPLVVAMSDWGRRIFRPDVPEDMVHTPCGAPLEIVYRCRACDARVLEDEVTC